MSSRKDYRYLLEELRDYVYNYSINQNGEVIDKSGNIVNDELTIANVDFLIEYSMAYETFDEKSANDKNKVNISYGERVLSSYGVFNNLINNLVSEYNVYGYIGTGYVSYSPYQDIAEYLFNNSYRILIKYLKLNVLNNEKSYAKR